MTLPADRNRRALKNAWVTSRKIAADVAPTPAATSIRPTMLIVEYARTRLMSSWPIADSPA